MEAVDLVVLGGGSRSTFGTNRHRRRRHVGIGGLFAPTTFGPTGDLEGSYDESVDPARSGVDPVALRRVRLLPMAATLVSITFAIALLISEQRDVLTLNGGESRRIIPGMLSRAVEVRKHSSSSKDRGVGASVYAIPEKHCPPLTGLTVTFSDEHSMTLGRQDYQYDFFHFNAGSTMSATLTQSSGASEVLLLRGKPSMDLKGGHASNRDWEEHRRDALASWFTHSGNEPERVSFQAKHSDTYMLVYDNASNSKGELKVQYTLKLTTYNLQHHTPVCADLVANGCRLIEKKSAGCIILATSPNTDGGGEITLAVSGSKNWSLMALLTVMPACLIALCEAQRSRKEQQ